MTITGPVATEIGRPNPGVLHELVRRAFKYQFPSSEHQDTRRETKHQVHVMFDHQDGNPGRQALQRVQNKPGLRLRNSSRWFVQQQNAGIERESQRKLGQPLLPIGDMVDHIVGDHGQAELVED
jgi:hypothetical protein